MDNTPTTERPSLWQRTTIRRFLKWLFSWRTMRRLLLAIAVIATLVAAFYAEEDLRGQRAWARYRQEMEARGEQLDWRALVPKPVPDDQNFAATPFVKSWFVRSNYVFRSPWKGDTYDQAQFHVDAAVAKARPDTSTRRFVDLVGWSRAFDVVRAGKVTGSQKFVSDELDLVSRSQAAPSVLDSLKTNEVAFAELRAASQRPYSRYPINYDVPDPAEILLPHLNSHRAICRRLGLKACAELVLGRSEEALEDVRLSISVADSLKGEPFLISYLVRVACLQIATQPIWEGLAEHAWSEAQLRELETRLQSYDFVADLKPTLDAERSWGVGIIDYIKHTGKLAELNDSGSGDESTLDRIVRMVPSGWYDQEQVSYCRLFALQMAGVFDPAAKRVFPSQLKSNEQALDRAFEGRNPFATIFIRHQLLSTMLLPALARVSVKGATAQVAADQAALACALERYRLAHGQFPETLDTLVPQFISPLPHDVTSGEPYKYRRTADGQFILYSVGWNEKDDGGVPGKTLFDEKEGDWVWQYPPQPKP